MITLCGPCRMRSIQLLPYLILFSCPQSFWKSNVSSGICMFYSIFKSTWYPIHSFNLLNKNNTRGLWSFPKGQLLFPNRGILFNMGVWESLCLKTYNVKLDHEGNGRWRSIKSCKIIRSLGSWVTEQAQNDLLCFGKKKTKNKTSFPRTGLAGIWQMHIQ